MPQSLPLYVDVNLDRPRKLFYNLRAFKAYGTKTGSTLFDLASNPMNIEMLSAAIWAGLIHEDKDLTIDDVDGMVHTGNLSEMIVAFGKAFSGNMPKSASATEDVTSPNAQPPAAPL